MMKLRRRTALKGAAASAVALSLWDGSAAVVSAAPESALRPANHGLPPNARLLLSSCSECGAPMGQQLVDEFDDPDNAVCHACYQEQVDEAIKAVARRDDADELWDVEAERDELQDILDVRSADLRKLSRLLERLDRQIDDLAYDMPWDAAEHLRVRWGERLRDLREQIRETMPTVTMPT